MESDFDRFHSFDFLLDIKDVFMDRLQELIAELYEGDKAAFEEE